MQEGFVNVDESDQPKKSIMKLRLRTDIILSNLWELASTLAPSWVLQDIFQDIEVFIPTISTQER